MRFERPQADVRPDWKDADQARLAVIRVVGDADVVDVDPVLPLEWRTLSRQGSDALGRLGRNHGEYVQVRRFSREPVMLANDESSDAVEIGGAVEPSIEVRQERKPRLGGSPVAGRSRGIVNVLRLEPSQHVPMRG